MLTRERSRFGSRPHVAHTSALHVVLWFAIHAARIMLARSIAHSGHVLFGPHCTPQLHAHFSAAIAFPFHALSFRLGTVVPREPLGYAAMTRRVKAGQQRNDPTGGRRSGQGSRLDCQFQLDADRATVSRFAERCDGRAADPFVDGNTALQLEACLVDFHARRVDTSGDCVESVHVVPLLVKRGRATGTRPLVAVWDYLRALRADALRASRSAMSSADTSSPGSLSSSSVVAPALATMSASTSSQLSPLSIGRSGLGPV